MEKKPEYTEHPLYRQAMAHFEAGEWEDAISLFSQLAAGFPDDASLQQILADLRLKASLSRGESRRGRIEMRRVARIFLLVLSVVAVMALLAGVSHRVYTNWLLPARTLRDQVTHLRELRELARGYMAAGDYARAADLYKEILSQVPDDSTATAGLERTEELQELVIAYDKALELTREERWDEALKAWQAILAADSNFRDVKHWTAFVEEQDLLSSLFKEAEVRYGSEDWSGAIEILEQVRGQNANYRRHDVEVLLVGSLVNLAKQILSEAPDPASVYNETMALFDKAIKIRPQDESVLTERAVAEAYSQGFALFQEEDWERAVEELRFAYEHNPPYATGKVVELLYLANIHCGDERAEAGDFQGALACYEAATELPVDDLSEASTKSAALLPMLTPSPTPRPPVPTATPGPRPTPTRTPTPTTTPTPSPTQSPYTFEYLPWLTQELDRPGCQAPSIEGRVVDAAGIGLPGVWVRIQWFDRHDELPTYSSGGFGFAPLGPESWRGPVPLRLTVIRSKSDPTPLSQTITLNFEGCLINDLFKNVTFKALQ